MKDKVVIVTGAGSGMGEAAARMFAQAGAKVVLAGRHMEKVEAVAAELRQNDHDAIAVQCDVSVEEQVAAMVDKAVETFGRLDAAFNNAGIQVPARLTADIETEEFDRIISINLRGIWLCMKYELKQMLRQGSGAIVNSSSIAGIMGAPTRAAYAATKHGIIGLTKTAAAEYAAKGIRVNAVCPGTIVTPMVDEMLKLGDLDEKASLEATPMHRFADPDEVISAVLFLCSDAASYINGHSLAIDGGQTII